MDKNDIQAQRRVDERLLQLAIEGGHLPEDSTVQDLTTGVRQKMIDSYHLRDAIKSGYLPQGSGIEDLTNDVRQKMINGGDFPRYMPDGSICDILDHLLDVPFRGGYIGIKDKFDKVR